jgi:hypothetical protein
MAQALERAVFDGYVEGLRETGWRGDPRMARFGYCAASVRRYISYTPHVLSILTEESQRVHWAESLRCSPEEVVNHLATFYRFVLVLGQEALELLDEL